MKRYGLRGDVSRDLLTYGGRVIVHDNAAELAYLVPHGARVVEVPRDVPIGQTLAVRHHPELAAVRWPLSRADFRRP